MLKDLPHPQTEMPRGGKSRTPLIAAVGFAMVESAGVLLLEPLLVFDVSLEVYYGSGTVALVLIAGTALASVFVILVALALTRFLASARGVPPIGGWGIWRALSAIAISCGFATLAFSIVEILAGFASIPLFDEIGRFTHAPYFWTLTNFTLTPVFFVGGVLSGIVYLFATRETRSPSR